MVDCDFSSVEKRTSAVRWFGKVTLLIATATTVFVPRILIGSLGFAGLNSSISSREASPAERRAARLLRAEQR